jgi:hypothetical protein
MIEEDNPVSNGEEEGKDDFPVRSTPLYAVLVCGIIMSGIGIYLVATQQMATGLVYAGRFGTGHGTLTSLGGYSVLILGLAVCAYPVYQLWKNSQRDGTE